MSRFYKLEFKTPINSYSVTTKVINGVSREGYLVPEFPHYAYIWYDEIWSIQRIYTGDMDDNFISLHNENQTLKQQIQKLQEQVQHQKKLKRNLAARKAYQIKKQQQELQSKTKQIEILDFKLKHTQKKQKDATAPKRQIIKQYKQYGEQQAMIRILTYKKSQSSSTDKYQGLFSPTPSPKPNYHNTK